VVNNAAILYDTWQRGVDADLDQVRAALETNLLGAWRVVQALLLNALTRILAAELRTDRILVNAICPCWVATDMGGAGGRPIAEGAAGIVWAVELPDDGPSGDFFRDGRALAW
jgi:NAD(P)-dependent dehydrogenase (short-subunit alcohol dehydrogenase family)